MLFRSADYTHALVRLIGRIGEGLTVVVDGGNGVAGPLYCSILRAVGCTVHELFIEPDGTFPNHAADPSKYVTLSVLRSEVVSKNADLGFAFDGDGDRMGLVDHQGNIVTADQTLLLLAKDHLSRHQGKPVVFTVSNSSLLETEVRSWSGVPRMCKVGHSFVEHAMHEHHAMLGGEQSGHYFCAEDYYQFDDAIVATLRILSLAQAQGLNGKTLSDILTTFPTVFQAEERRPFCADDAKAEVVARATEYFKRLYPVITLDGVRIDFGEGAWAGIRYSNTSPCLSICIEARSEERLQEVEHEVLEYLRTEKEVDV